MAGQDHDHDQQDGVVLHHGDADGGKGEVDVTDWIATHSFGPGVYLTIVNTDFRSLFLSPLIAFHPLRGYPGS